jgi:hypothetical protein
MKKFKLFQTIGFAALLAALLFASCEQEAFTPANLTGEPAALNAAVNIAPKPITQAPLAWRPFTPLPFSGMTGITSVSGLATNGAYLVATAYDGSAAYTSRYDPTINVWSRPMSLAPYGVTIKPGAVHYLQGWYLVTGSSTSLNGAYSPDGTNWKQTGTIGFGTKAAVYGPRERLYVVAGQGGQAAYTPDLNDNFIRIPPAVTGWTTGSGSQVYINAAAYGAGRYVFGGGSGRIAYTDSILNPPAAGWTTAASPLQPTDIVDAIAYGGDDTFVASADNGKAGILIYSNDGGQTWQLADTYASPDVLNTGIFALTYDNGFFVAVNDVGFAAWSKDGITWTDANSVIFVGTTARVDAVVFYPAINAFLAGGGDSSGVNMVISP